MCVRVPAISIFFSILAVAACLAQNPSQVGNESYRDQPFDASPTGNEQDDFALAEDYYNGGAGNQALVAYRRFVKLYPSSPKAAQAQYKIAEILEAQGQLSKAFDAYQTLVTRFPDTPEFEKAVSQQILIANKFLAGRRIKIAGIALLPGAERAQIMYEQILKNAPYSKNAAISQFNLGLAHEKQGKTAEARQAYQTVLDNYANSTVADDALYQIAYIYMRTGLTGRSEDLSSLVLAKETFEDFLLQFPNSEKAAQARDNLKTIGDNEAADIMAIAQYYDWSKNYRAAVIYYNDVIRRQPNSTDAETARNRVQVLRSDFGDDALRVGAERAETGEKAAVRRRLQAQVESSALSDYAGPPRRDLVPDELPIARPSRLRTNVRDVQPLPAVEPALPTQ
jgi:outer membrane protein assembly factor BamD